MKHFVFKPLRRVRVPLTMLVAFQLALTGIHELSEARWLPSSKQEMAIVGPIVRNELFFFVFIFGAAALLVLREWQSASQAAAAKEADSDAERRLREAQNRRSRRWMAAAAVGSLAVILVLTADFIYARANSAPPVAHLVTASSEEIRIPIREVEDGNLHLFTVDSPGRSIRFMIIKKPTGWGTALDACAICGAEGYRQDGQNVVCRHCASAVYVPTIGSAGGCNPVGVPSEVVGSDLILRLPDLDRASAGVSK